MHNYSNGPSSIPGFNSLYISRHALKRMDVRKIDEVGINIALEYGRIIYTRGAVIYALGIKENYQHAELGPISAKYEGLQVVCSLDGKVLTAYRNKNFKSLRCGLGRGRYNPITNPNKKKIHKGG